MSEYAVINTCYGGFGISEKARNLMGVTKAQIYQIERNNKLLVDVVRRLGQEASDKHAKLVAVKLKPATRYVIYEFDGMEYISEEHKIFDHKQNKWVFASKMLDTNDFVITTIKTK